MTKSLPIFLGAFQIQSVDIEMAEPYRTQTTFRLREKTSPHKQQHWTLSTRSEEEDHTVVRYLSSSLSLRTWWSSEPAEARWEQSNNSYLASEKTEAWIDAEGIWSLLSFEDTLSFVLDETGLKWPIKLKTMGLSPWLALPQKLHTPKGQATIKRNKMRPGSNRATVLAEGANKKSVEISFEALGLTSSLTLAPWLFHKDGTPSELRLQLQREEIGSLIGSFVGSLRLQFCGTGVLRVYFFDLPSGKSTPIQIENWDPFATVIHEQRFRWSNEQLLPFSSEVPICHVETDGPILGLQRIAVYSSFAPVLRLYAYPSHSCWTYPFDPFSLQFYRMDSAGSIHWISSLEDWSWRWHGETPEDIIIESKENALYFRRNSIKKDTKTTTSVGHFTLHIYDPHQHCCVFYLSFEALVANDSPTLGRG